VFVVANAQRIDVVPFFRDLRPYYHVSYTGVGALLSAYLLGYVVAQVPMGLAADNLPTRRVTLTGLLLITLTSGAFALTRAYWLAMTLRVLMGVSGAALYSSTVKLLLGTTSNRGSAMGVLQSGAGAGMLVGLFVMPLASQLTSLGTAFVGLAATSAAVFCLALIGLPAGAPPRPATETLRQQVASVARQRQFVYLSSCTFLGLFSAYGVIAWIPTYLRTGFGYGAAAAGAIASLINVTLALVSPGAGTMSDRMGRRGSVILSGFGVLALAFAVLVGTRSPLAIGASAAVAGIGLALTLPVITTMTMDVFGVERAGVAVALNLSVGQIASTLSAVLFGFLLDVTGSFQLVWAVGLLGALAGFIPAFALHRLELSGAAARPKTVD
jgi:predicted MFS family arabinose efflux permease